MENVIPNPLNYAQVNHIDGNKENNCVDNLEWCDSAHNYNHAVLTGLINVKGENNPMAKITDLQRTEIIERRKSGETLKEISEKYGLTFQTVSKITIDAGLNIKLNRYRNYVRN